MTTALSDEQKLIEESVARFINQRYEFAERRRIIATDPGFQADHWAQFAELGWLALPFDESVGGLGGSVRDVSIIAEGLGRGLYVGPYVSSLMMAGGIVAAVGNDAQKTALLEPLMGGEVHLAFAFAEPQSRYELNDVQTTATPHGAGFKLNGHKSVVLFASCADHLVVTARTAGERNQSSGLSLFLVAADAVGLELQSYATVDGNRGAEVRFSEVSAELLGPIDEALPIVEAVCDTAIVILCAEAVGCMASLYEKTLEYIKQREQFGAAIGSFQAIQHRMVDVFMSYELARSLTYATASRFDESPSPTDRARLASAVKFEIAKCGRHIGQESIQLHGGMGMTDEMSIGHYFKRLTAINATLGDRHFHLDRFRRLDS